MICWEIDFDSLATNNVGLLTWLKLKLFEVQAQQGILSTTMLILRRFFKLTKKKRIRNFSIYSTHVDNLFIYLFLLEKCLSFFITITITKLS